MDLCAALVFAEFVSVKWLWKAKFQALLNHPGNPYGGDEMSVTDPIADMLTRIRNGGHDGPSCGCDAEFEAQGGNCPYPERRRLSLKDYEQLKVKNQAQPVLRAED